MTDANLKKLLGALAAAAVAFFAYFGYQITIEPPDEEPVFVDLNIVVDDTIAVNETTIASVLGRDSAGNLVPVDAEWCVHPDDVEILAATADGAAVPACTEEQLNMTSTALASGAFAPGDLAAALRRANQRVRSTPLRER